MEQLLGAFWELVTKSPPALVTLTLSVFMGYGVSFLVFDYGKSEAEPHGWQFHIAVGLGYAALIFLGVNGDIIGRKLTTDQMIERIPITFLVSFAILFIVIVIVSMLRRRGK